MPVVLAPVPLETIQLRLHPAEQQRDLRRLP
jgi:hypothetical protein